MISKNCDVLATMNGVLDYWFENSCTSVLQCCLLPMVGNVLRTV